MLEVSKGSALRGEIAIPGDKSLTHRAYMFAAFAETPSEVSGYLKGEDCEATLRCLQQMGLQVNEKNGVRTLHPASEWRSPQSPLDCGNSGTTMRLMSGLIASRPITATLVGDASLSRRPMKRIATPLRLMGAEIEGDQAPLQIRGKVDLQGISYQSPVASAQVKSCVLLAGLRAEGETTVTEPSLSRDHTERMLEAMGIPVRREGLSVTVQGGSQGSGFRFRVPGDISSAAFWMVAAALVPGSEVVLKGVGMNPSRTGIIDVFAQAAIPVEALNPRQELGEPVADLRIVHAPCPKPFLIEGDLVPRLVDEIPVLALLATQCSGTTIIRNAEEVRVKESDRIQVVGEALKRMGADLDILPDGMEIRGGTPLTGVEVDAALDHRIAMTFAVAGLISSSPVRIQGEESIHTSYPTFLDHLSILRS